MARRGIPSPVRGRRCARAAFVCAATAACALGATSLGCGATVPFGGVQAEMGPSGLPEGELRAADLLPADLDVVLRFDLTALREGLGAEPTRALRDRVALRDGEEEELVANALEHGSVGWLGLRLADARLGDRVLVVETPERKAPTIGRFRRLPERHPDVQLFRVAGEVERDAVALVALVGEHDVLFASPVEGASIERVVRDGPDAGRAEPEAEGLVSVEWRVARAANALAKRFPSLAKLLHGIERLRATLRPSAGDVVLEARIGCQGARAAENLERFLTAIRDGARERPRYAELFGGMEIGVKEATVVMRWPLTVAALVKLVREPPDLAGELPDAAPAAPAGGEPGAAPAPAPAAPR